MISNRLRLAVAFGAAVVCTRPFAADAEDTITTPYEGIRHIERVTGTPNRIHIVEVDLTNPKIRLRATRSQDRQRTVSSFADLYDCQIATNGDFFSYEDYSTSGVAVGHGQKWGDTSDNSTQGYLGVGVQNEVGISLPSKVQAPEDWMSDVVGGRPLVVNDGAAVTFSPCSDPFCVRNPRTAVGFNEAKTRMWLVVVDGRSSSSVGVSLNELGTLMKGLGAHRALNLDGGGSSAMYIKAEGGLVSSPSEGTQRVVANHLGVCVVPPFGTLRGYIRKDDIYDETAGMAGVTVSLSTGQSAVTADDGLYEIAEVPRGDVTISAAADGLAGERAVYVTADDLTWGSIAMSEDTGDGDGDGDDEPGSDAGIDDDEPDDGDMGGGCSTSGSGAPLGPLLLLALLGTRTALSRRRN
jgi:hypothetical protein